MGFEARMYKKSKKPGAAAGQSVHCPESVTACVSMSLTCVSLLLLNNNIMPHLAAKTSNSSLPSPVTRCGVRATTTRRSIDRVCSSGWSAAIAQHAAAAVSGSSKPITHP